MTPAPRQRTKTPSALRPARALAFAAVAALLLAFAATRAPAQGGANIPTPTFPNSPLWGEREPVGHRGWSVQRNLVTGHWRLLDDANIRRAWGTRDECVAAFENEARRLAREETAAKAAATAEGAVVASTFPSSEPNVPMPTFGGKQFWMDHRVRYGWRLQQNVLTGHWRALDPSDFRQAWGTRAAVEAWWDANVAPEIARIESENGPPEKIVVCVNGIVRAKETWTQNIGDIRERAKRDGRNIEAWGLNYPSTRVSIEDAADAMEEAMSFLPPDIPIVIVCHSMGGLLANTWLGRRGRLATSSPRAVETIVYLGTPFAGSPLADWLRDWYVYEALYGPAGDQLVTSPAHLSRYPWPDCRTVCVGGSNPPDGFSDLLDGDDDGTVQFFSAVPDAATRKEAVPATHSFIMHNARSREIILEEVFR